MEERRVKVAESLDLYHQRFNATYSTKCTFDFENNEAPKMILGISNSQTAIAFSNNQIMFWNNKNPDIIDKPHQNSIDSVAQSISGIYTISGSSDSSIKVFKEKKEHKHIKNAHQGTVTALAFSFDDKHFASGSSDHSLKLWNPESEHWDHDFGNAHKDAIVSLAFTVDHKLISGANDGVIKVWNLDNKSLAFELAAHIGPVKCITSSAKLNLFISCGSQDGKVKMFDTTKHDPIHVLSEPHKTPAVHAVSLTGEGKHFLTAHYFKREVIVYSVETKLEVKRFTKIHDGSLEGVGFVSENQFTSIGRDQMIKVTNIDTEEKTEHPIFAEEKKASQASQNNGIVSLCVNSHELFASDQSSKNVKIWNIETGKETAGVNIYLNHVITHLVYCPNTTPGIVITASENSIRYWQISNRQPYRPIENVFEDKISTLCATDDGGYFAAGSTGSKTKVWKVSHHGEKIEKPTGYESLPIYGKVQATSIRSDGKAFMAVYLNKAIVTWNLENKRQTLSYQDDTNGDFLSASISPNWKYVVIGSDSIIKLWSADEGKIIKTFQNAHTGPILSVSAGSHFFVSSKVPDKSMKYWSIDNLTEVFHFTNLHSEAVTTAVLDEKNNKIFTGSLDGMVKSWDTSSMQLYQKFGKLPVPILTSMAFSESGDSVVCGYSSGDINTWSLDKYNLTSKYVKAHDDWVTAIAMSSDSRLIVSGSSKTIKLWKTENKSCHHTFNDSHKGEVSSLVFSQDSKILVSGSTDGTIILWNLETMQKIYHYPGEKDKPISSVSFNKITKKFVFTGFGHTSVQVWDSDNKKFLTEYKKDAEIDPKVMAISSSCDEAVFSTTQRKVYSWKFGEPKPSLLYEHPEIASIQNLAISSDGNYFASYGTETGKILIWNKAKKKIEHDFYAIPYKAVSCSKIAPNDSFLAVACSDNSITLHDARVGSGYNVLHRFEHAHSDYITFIDISVGDGRYMASTSKDRSIKYWDVQTRTLLHHIQKAFDCTVNSVSISPDFDKIIATGAKSAKILVWNILENKYEPGGSIEKAHEEFVGSAFYARNGNFIISHGTTDTSIKFWDPKTWQIMHTFEKAHNDVITCLALSDDCKTLVSGSLDKSIKMWYLSGIVMPEEYKGNRAHIEKAKMRHNVKKIFDVFENAHAKGVQSISISGQNKYIASGSRDKEMKLWGVKSKKCIHVFAQEDKPPHSGIINSLSISTDGKTIVSSGSTDSRMRVWVSENPERVQEKTDGLSNEITAIALARDADIVLTVSFKEMKLFKTEEKTAHITFSSEEHTEQISAAAISSDGNTVISVSADKTMIVWKEQKAYKKPYAHEKPIETVALSRDNKIIVTGSQDKSLKLWNIDEKNNTVNLVHHFKNAHDDTVKSVAISSNNKYCVSGSLDSTMKLWDLEAKKMVHNFENAHIDSVNCVQISADNRFIVSGSSDKRLRIWNLYTEQSIKEFADAHTAPILAVGISPDSKLIVSASADKSIKLWSFEALRQMHHYEKAHDNQITSVAITAENKYIVSGSLDKKVKLWKIPPLIVLSKAFSIYFGLKPELHGDDIILPFMWNSMHMAALNNKLDFKRETEEVRMLEPDFMGNLPIDYILNENIEYNDYVQEKMRLLKDIRKNDHKSFLKIMKAMRLDYINFLKRTSLANPKLVKEFLALCIDEIDDKQANTEEVANDLQLKIYGMPTKEYVESDKPIITTAIQEKLVEKKPLRTYKLRYITTTMPLDLDLGSENIKNLLLYLSEQSQRFIFEDKFVLYILSYLWKKTKPYQRAMFWIYTIFMILVSAESTNRDPSQNGLNYFIIIYSCFLMSMELVQLTAQFSIDFWSMFDWITNSFVIATMIIYINNPSTFYLPYLRTIYLFAGYFRWLAYLRIFDGIRALIRAIIEILKDMSSFMLILIFTIFCYTFILEGFNYGGNNDFFKHLFDSYQFLYNSELDGAEVGLQALQVIFPFVINVVFLNMLITIMGDTFDRTQEKITYSDNVEKVEIILEIVQLIIKLRAIKNFIKKVFSRNTYSFAAIKRCCKAICPTKSRNKKRISTEKRQKLVKSIVRELKQTDKKDDQNETLQYILKCDYKAEEETEDEWSGKLNYLLKKNIEAIEKGEIELENELGNKITEMTPGDVGAKDRIEKLETNVETLQKDVEEMGEHINRIYKLFESQIMKEVKTSEVKTNETKPNEIKLSEIKVAPRQNESLFG